MNASQLKEQVESHNPDSKFFSRENMNWSGDTMGNYGVRGPFKLKDMRDSEHEVYELYRRHPVKYGLTRSAYFDAVSFLRVRAADL
jgi:hypothetical protein